MSSSSNDETLDSTQVSEVLHDSSGLNSKIEGVEPKPILTEPAKSVTPPGETQDNDEDVLGAEVNSMLDDVLHARSSSAKLPPKNLNLIQFLTMQKMRVLRRTRFLHQLLHKKREKILKPCLPMQKILLPTKE